MLKITVIRHGETIWNERNIIQGQKDVPLSERGRRQAEMLGERLKGEKFDLFFSSPLQRAYETSQIINAGLGNEIIVADELKEINLGDWVGKRVFEVGDGIYQWFRDPKGYRPPNGETVLELSQRIRKFLKERVLGLKDANILVSAHEASGKLVIFELIGLDVSFFWRVILSNASLSCVWVHDNGWVELVCLNDTCHLDGLNRRGDEKE